MNRWDRIGLKFQMILGVLALVLLAPLYFLGIKAMGYRIRDLKALREACRDLFQKHRGPWLICANHLTMIDSLLLVYGMVSLPEHFSNYRRLPWNLPERNNFQSNIVLAALCYLAKCIPVNRGGDRRQMKSVLDKCSYLLDNGHSVMIFPEGGRSRFGRVDTENFSYGVGRFIESHPSCRVLCLYLRGERQTGHTVLPRFGETLYAKAEELTVKKAAAGGLRGQRELARQVIDKLASMEEGYFAWVGQRYSRSCRYRDERKGQRLPIPQQSSNGR